MTSETVKEKCLMFILTVNSFVIVFSCYFWWRKYHYNKNYYSNYYYFCIFE